MRPTDAASADQGERESCTAAMPAVLVLALTGEGLETMGNRVADGFEATMSDVELLIRSRTARR